MFEKLKTVNQEELCKKLGYKTKKISLCLQKLQILTESKSLYEFFKRKDVGFDFVYTSEEFVKRVCKELNISICEEEIKKAKEYEKKHQEQYAAIIFIDTGFKRKNEPIFALAFMEGKRRIRFEKEWLVKTPFEEQLKKISELVKKHYKEHNGKLPLWGTIKRYVYYFDNDKTPVIFNSQGEIVSEPVCYNEASLHIK